MKNIICLFSLMCLFSCVDTKKDNNNNGSLGTDKADIKSGHSLSGLQFLETYNKAEIHDLLKQSGLDSLVNPWTQNSSRDNDSLNESPMLYSLNVESKIKLEQYLSQHPEIMKFFPGDLELMWSAYPEEFLGKGNLPVYHLYAVKNSGLKITDLDISKSWTVKENASYFAVRVYMTRMGAERWGEMTARNKGKYIALTLHDKVYFAPMVRSAINSGDVEISGNFNRQQAEELSSQISSRVSSGEWRSYHKNGQIKEIRHYEKGEQVVGWSTYDEKGTLIKKGKI